MESSASHPPCAVAFLSLSSLPVRFVLRNRWVCAAADSARAHLREAEKP